MSFSNAVLWKPWSERSHVYPKKQAPVTRSGPESGGIPHSCPLALARSYGRAGLVASDPAFGPAGGLSALAPTKGRASVFALVTPPWEAFFLLLTRLYVQPL